MDFIQYAQMNGFQKFFYNIGQFFVKLPHNILRLLKFIGRAIVGFVLGIGRAFKFYGLSFVKGDWSTKISYLIMGFGIMVKGQIVKGIIFLAVEVAYFAFLFGFAWQYISKFFTLGDVISEGGMDPLTGMPVVAQQDDSMLILLYSVLTIFVTVLFLMLYVVNIRVNVALQDRRKNGVKINSFVEDLRTLLDERYHVTLLSLPTVLICLFTVLPMIFMVLIAFTNFDRFHPMGGLFDWIGFGNFADVFFNNPKKAYTFQNLVGWTLCWAIIATISCYIVGVIFALMINKKGIKGKSVFRTMFVMTVAVPQFVTLLLMSQILSDNVNGVANILLRNIGIIGEGQYIKFLTDPWLAKITVLVVNLWIGVPYTILSASGILMNIPEDLYESAKIDGAGPITTFVKITMPYMLFVMTPALIQQFIGNINNFNVIYFLTAGGPTNSRLYNAGDTDLLVTWLFSLTTSYNDYSLAATIGILVFIFCAALSLITFNMTKSAKDEEAFS